MMSSWQEDLEHLLSQLGVQQETSQSEPPEVASQSTFFFTHLSRSRPGVFYRTDLVGDTPELRVFVPANDGGLLKFQVYLVHLARESVLAHLFGLFLVSEGGSPAYQEIEGIITFHLLEVLSETMKRLFWLGDLVICRFPPEIEVERLA
jgi:hypothetical protein